MVRAYVNTSAAEISWVPSVLSVFAVNIGALFWFAHWINAEMEYVLTMQVE